MPFIYSTLTAGQTYTKDELKPGNDLPFRVAAVHINGGSNIPDQYLRTPIGVETEVNDEDMSVLRDNEIFQMHVKNGFIRVENKKFNAEVVASDMDTRDQSAPLLPEDFPADQQAKTNAPETPAPKPAPKSNSRRA